MEIICGAITLYVVCHLIYYVVMWEGAKFFTRGISREAGRGFAEGANLRQYDEEDFRRDAEYIHYLEEKRRQKEEEDW